ncbi:long-chain-fatty-acid--CoA ligase [Sphingobium sp. V4]|uniref:long-chain-fatty-acid--CoA ligase n=1 Tax=Sphingobium sp. V4 TaxID=3038927 RepID=UPI002557DBF0|nr:long-chain-fatty-acid--CoA ligase [Sphingobium sp. V4]WIW89499.1 long-chain-fatty-acid--CoA ligase [Sphingobium sp. V4]
MPLIEDIAEIRNLPGLIYNHASTRGSAPALSFEGTTWTYLDFATAMEEVASALRQSGISSGDRVAYLGKNAADFAFLWAGASLVGAVVVPLNWRLTIEEAIDIIHDAEAKCLFLDPDYVVAEDQLLGALPQIEWTVHCSSAGPRGFAHWRSSAADVAKLPLPGNEAIAIQLYTSGTTGRPKGVLLSHDSIFWQRAASETAQVECDCQVPDDVLLVSLTISHVGGLVTFARAFFSGAHAVILREFKPMDVLEAVSKYRVSRLTVVPSTLQQLVEAPQIQEIDTSSVKIIQYGAAPIPLELLQRGLDVFGCDFVQVYGMTEAGGTVATLPPEDHSRIHISRMKSVGKPLPGVGVRIVSSEGESCEPGIVGEIQVRTRAIMHGYWNLPAETAAAFSDEGYYRTGDAGYLDEDGYLFLCDRIKDMIVTGAENVYPAEVENALFAHPDVQEVAVIGIPDERWGEAVTAIVVLKPGSSATEADLIRFAKSKIAGFKAPKSVIFRETLPRNAAGKVLRRVLSDPYWAGRERRIN